MAVRRRHLVVPNRMNTFIGISCSLGHDGRRYEETGQCVTCVEIYSIYQGDKSDLKRIAADGVTPKIHGRVLLLAQGGRCAHCGAADDKMELDHKTSIEFGGNNWPRNRQWLCRTCNRRKWCHGDAEYRVRHNIPTVTTWDAPPHIVRLLDKDARLIGESFLKRRFAHSRDAKAALRGLLSFSRRKGSPLAPNPETRGEKKRGRPPKAVTVGMITEQFLLDYACLI